MVLVLKDLFLFYVNAICLVKQNMFLIGQEMHRGVIGEELSAQHYDAVNEIKIIRLADSMLIDSSFVVSQVILDDKTQGLIPLVDKQGFMP